VCSGSLFWPGNWLSRRPTLSCFSSVPLGNIH
jgi:hypothetical protein